MEHRKYKRLPYINRRREDMDNLEQIFIEIHLDQTEFLRAEIFDISLGGAAIEINGLDDKQLEKLKSLKDFFIKLHFVNHEFLLSVESVWHIASYPGGSNIYKCGLKFSLISDDDRLKLSALIEELRSSGVFA